MRCTALSEPLEASTIRKLLTLKRKLTMRWSLRWLVALWGCGLVFGVLSIGGFALLNQGAGLSVPQSLGLVMLIALPVAIWLNGRNLPGPVLGNDDVTFWFVSQRMFPPIVSAFALFLLYAEMNKAGVRLLDSFPRTMVLSFLVCLFVRL